MKVVVLCQYPLHGIWGSPAMYVERLTHHISYTKDVEVHVITIGDIENNFKKGKVNIHVIKIPRYFRLPLFIPIITLILRHKILKINPDVVHAAQGTLPPYSTAAAYVRYKYPVLLTVLGIVAKETKYKSGIRYRIESVFNILNENYVVSKIPNIIMETQSLKNLISTMTKSKIYVVQVGIEYNKIQEVLVHLNDKPDIFLAIGLTKLKGIDVLIITPQDGDAAAAAVQAY